MKKDLTFKIVVSNLSILFFVFGIFFTINNFLNHKLDVVLFEKKQIIELNGKINVVASSLYQSSSLHDDSYLVTAAMSSSQVMNTLKHLHLRGFDVSHIKENYIDFFKYTVITTSMLLEDRLDDATAASKVSLQKHQLLQTKIDELIKLLNEKQENIILEIRYMIFISSGVLLFLILGNIIYLKKAYSLSNKKQQEINKTFIQRAAMIDAIGDGVYGIDKDGLCTFINQSALDMLGFGKEEVLGTHQHHLFHHHKPDNSIYKEDECPIYKTSKDKQKRVCNDHFITKDGHFFPVSLAIAPSGDEDVVVVFKDISKEVEVLNCLSQKNKELDRLAITDALSGIYNRRYFDENFEKEFSKASRANVDFCVGICDIDYFKNYNDTYGHQKGDDVIKAVADVLKQTFNRQIDIVARYGGEEFVFILSATSKDDTLKLVQKAKDKIELLDIEHKESKISSHITLSFGVICGIPKQTDSSFEWLQMADKALYESKQSGRNYITIKEF